MVFFSSPLVKTIYSERLGRYKSLSVSTNSANSFSHPTFALVAKDVAETNAPSLNFL